MPPNRAGAAAGRAAASGNNHILTDHRDMRTDNVKGTLIILVVFGHFLLPLEQTKLVTNLVYGIYSFHMPCFVMISGFYAKGMMKGGRLNLRKTLQILWLYLCYEIVVYFTEGLLEGDILRWPDFLHESGAPWYLFALFIWYLFLPLFDRFKNYPLSAISIMVLTLAVAFGKYFVYVKDFLCMDRVLSFAPFFYLGYYCSQRTLNRYIASGIKRYINILFFIILAVILIFTYNHFQPFSLVVYGAQYSRYIYYIQPYLWFINLAWYAVAFIMSLGLLGLSLNRPVNPLTSLGQRTLQIYFLHRPIRDILEFAGFYKLFDPNSILSLFLLFVFSYVLTLSLSGRAMGVIFAKIRSMPDTFINYLSSR